MRDIQALSTTAVLAVAPAMGPALDSVNAPRRRATFDRRGVLTAGLSVGIGIAAALVAQILTTLITNLAFHGRLPIAFVPPAENRLVTLVLVVLVIGGVVVGLMARYGSPSIRGHWIPEVLDKVLNGQSRIPARLMFLKPVSAAVAIGTGGPRGAEGRIIATGGALGSMVGQVSGVSADERNTLLAAGAAAGMSTTFGSPVWFSATVRTACVVERRGIVLFMDSLHVFMAAGWEDARERAMELGRSHEAEYINADGESVRWRCKEILTLDILPASGLDGAEVHSRFVDVAPPAAADDFRPEDSTPYQTL